MYACNMYFLCMCMRMRKLTYLFRVHTNWEGQIGGCQGFLDTVRVFMCVCMYVYNMYFLCMCMCMRKLTYFIRVHIKGEGQIGGCQGFLNSMFVCM